MTRFFAWLRSLFTGGPTFPALEDPRVRALRAEAIRALESYPHPDYLLDQDVIVEVDLHRADHAALEGSLAGKIVPELSGAIADRFPQVHSLLVAPHIAHPGSGALPGRPRAHVVLGRGGIADKTRYTPPTPE